MTESPRLHLGREEARSKKTPIADPFFEDLSSSYDIVLGYKSKLELGEAKYDATSFWDASCPCTRKVLSWQCFQIK